MTCRGVIQTCPNRYATTPGGGRAPQPRGTVAPWGSAASHAVDGAADGVRRVTMLHPMIGDPALRWAVTVLFGASMTMYAYLAVAQHDRWRCTVSHLIHLVMSAAMIAMAWTVDLPAGGPTAFFLLAGVWFVYTAARISSTSRERLKTCYYAAMMAAMAWMCTLMGPGVPATGARMHAPPDSMAMDMPDMGPAAHAMPAAHSTGAGFSWVALVNWSAAIGFAGVTLYWSCRFLGERRKTRSRPTVRGARLEPLYQAFTAAGTALMFGALVW